MRPQPKSAPSRTASTPVDLSTDSAQQLFELEGTNRLRHLRVGTPQGRFIEVDGRRLLNLASNDYLGLSQHPKLIEAAIEATQKHGVGAGASRLLSGTQRVHDELEERFAAFKHAEAALILPTGYTANLAVLTTLAKAGDLIVMDKLVHASLIDAARASAAEVRTFPHLDLDRAEQVLQRHTGGRRFIVTDSIFSMDGDCADLPALCDLADRSDASLILDEAHGTGVLGNDGSGLAEAQGVGERVYASGAGGLVISTASKALGGLGGLITANRPVIDLLINKARPFIYSTAMPPAHAATIMAALKMIHDEPQRRHGLIARTRHLLGRLSELGWAVPLRDYATPIIPLIVGNEQAALDLADRLKEHGFFAPAIRPPTVAPGSSRVRLSLRSDLTHKDIDRVTNAIGSKAY